jgi:hypothetical protein
MSRKITVDGVATGASLVVSDAEYANIDWGNSVDDVVVINLENGGAAVLNWESIGAVLSTGSTTPPGLYPGWLVDVSGPFGGINGLHVSDATKDTLVAALASADVIVEFTTLQGTDVILPSKNATVISFYPADLVVPSP